MPINEKQSAQVYDGELSRDQSMPTSFILDLLYKKLKDMPSKNIEKIKRMKQERYIFYLVLVFFVITYEWKIIKKQN